MTSPASTRSSASGNERETEVPAPATASLSSRASISTFCGMAAVENSSCSSRDDEVSVDGARMLQEWSSPDAPRHPMRVYRDGELYRVSSDLGWFTVDPAAPSIAVPDTELDIGREQIATVTGMLLCFHAAGDTGLHAAAVEVDGEAIVLAAPGTFGKTTLAAAFWRAGHRVLTEDLVCLRSRPDPRRAGASDDPAASRRGRALDLPDAKVSSRRRAGSVSHSQTPAEEPPTRSHSRRRHPAPRSEGGSRLEAASKPDAIRDLWTLCGLFPTEEDYARRFAAVGDLVEAVPVYNLFRDSASRNSMGQSIGSLPVSSTVGGRFRAPAKVRLGVRVLSAYVARPLAGSSRIAAVLRFSARGSARKNPAAASARQT